MADSIDEITFRDSLRENAPPAHWSEPLKALWYDASGQWNESHEIAQDLTSREGSWIHGYLHLKEGDRWNAAYWYRRAGRDFPEHSVNEEFEVLLKSMLDLQGGS